MTSSILVLHTALQLEQASNLVDLLEASLPLGDGVIRCTSLPGYAWTDGGHTSIPHAQAGAAIALVDDAALGDAQLLCDLGAVWATGKRVAVIVERAELRQRLPLQLRDSEHVLERGDRAALAALVEDIAFDMNVDPRLGREANRLIEVISVPPPPPSSPPRSAPPPSARPPSPPSSVRPAQSTESRPAPRSARPHEDETPAVNARPPSAESRDAYEAIDTVPPPPAPVFSAFAAPAAPAREDDTVEPLDLIEDAELEPEPEPLRAAPEPRPSQPVVRVRCEVALEAGRAIGEAAFHGEEGDPRSAELEGDFASFVEGLGGSFEELQGLGDIEQWLGAIDNLLESLPQSGRVFAEWYEIGFQYATLKCIAEQGMPESGEDREVYEEMWNRALGQLRESAKVAGLPSHELRRVQALLENVVGPTAYRDYTNLGASLRELRELARNADRPANRYARLVN